MKELNSGEGKNLRHTWVAETSKRILDPESLGPGTRLEGCETLGILGKILFDHEAL